MNRLTRGPAPAPLGESDGERVTRRAWYGDLRDAGGRIRDRWNQRDSDGDQPIRDAVRSMSDGECAWCGKLVPDADMEVDHYLPKAHFPRLAYCWSVYLPSCGDCNNRRKRDFVPRGLPDDSVHDPALASNSPEGQPYVPNTVLGALEHRLVEPTFDDPADHLEFEPLLATYQERTETGRVTISRFFNDKERAEWLTTLQEVVIKDVKRSTSRADLDEQMQRFISLVGHSFYIRAFADAWLAIQPPAWSLV